MQETKLMTVLRWWLVIITILLLSYDAYSESEYAIRPVEGKEYEVKDGRILFRKGTGGIMVEPVTGDIVARYYAERGARSIGNPFSQGDFAETTIFLVTILNRSNGNATFTPGLVTLRIKTEATFPLDIAELMAAMETAPGLDQKILENSVYHSPEIVKAGQVSSKFLMFPPLPNKKIEFKLEFDYIYFETKEIRATFNFIKEKVRR